MAFADPADEPNSNLPREEEAARRVRLLCLDVDGVLTDGGLWIDDRGREFKRFDVRDGLGIRRWIGSGGEIAAITGRPGAAVRHRLRELGVARLVAASGPKLPAIERLLEELSLDWTEVAMIGDDLPDLPVLARCGLSIAVADAVAEVRAVSAWTTSRPGGRGAVREAIDRMLAAQGRHPEAAGPG